MKRRSTSIAETRAFAVDLLARLKKEKRRHALVLVLSGNLGSGKTAFVKALAQELGVRERVQSPTFVLEKIYRIPPRGRRRYCFERLIHIDAYRLDHPRELIALGFSEQLKDDGNLIVIEWGEKVKRILPKAHHMLRFKFLNENTRLLALIK